jgi:hypothetical protein
MTKANVVSDDSTKVIDSGNKRIIVTENTGKQRVEVEVYELSGGNVVDAYEKIFEGHYREGKVHEQRRSLLSIDIPAPLSRLDSKRFNRNFVPHYAGFGIGFAGFADRGESADMPLHNGKSFEINLNLLQEAIPISRRFKWAVVTGFGIRWSRYHLKGNHYFEEIDDYTHLITAPDEIRLKESRLGITTLNLPLLIEWQNRTGSLFFSAGVECSFRTASSSRIRYADENGKRQREKVDTGMTLRPVTMDVLVQAGSNNIGVFSRYSPVSLFEKNKGLELYPLTIGVMLYFR